MKKEIYPKTKIKKKEPNINDSDWLIWAAWADRITFEEIFEKTGKSEKDIIVYMRKSLKPSSFKLWRERVRKKSIKHRKIFADQRKKVKREKIKFDFE